MRIQPRLRDNIETQSVLFSLLYTCLAFPRKKTEKDERWQKINRLRSYTKADRKLYRHYYQIYTTAQDYKK